MSIHTDRGAAIARRGLDVILEWQTPGEAFIAGPTFSQYGFTWFRDSDKQWDEGTNFVYGVYDPAGRLVGGTGYHVRNGPGALEIGYWLARIAEGKGLMTRVAAALTEAAATVDGVTRVEIHCDAANVRSAAIPERLGYALVRVEDREIVAPAESGRHLIYAIEVQALDG